MTGIVRTHLGQSFAVVDQFDRERRDGTMATILVWQSPCAECGEPFSFTTPAASSKWEPSKRCQKHKRPGVRASGGRA